MEGVTKCVLCGDDTAEHCSEPHGSGRGSKICVGIHRGLGPDSVRLLSTLIPSERRAFYQRRKKEVSGEESQ